MGKEITITKIAKLSGVSRQVVSAILLPSETKAKSRFSEETKKRIEGIAKDTNFRPNRTWINATQDRHGSIGVLTRNSHLIPGFSNLSHILQEAQKNNFFVTFEKMGNDQKELPQFIKENVVDGLIIYEDLGKEINDKIKKYNIPTIFVNTNTIENVNTVNYDETDLMTKLVNRFKKLNKTNILYLDSSIGEYFKIRKKALIKICKQNNLPNPVIYNIKNSTVNANTCTKTFEEIKNVINDNPEIDAIILERHSLGGFLYRVLEDMNRKIPNDVSIVSILHHLDISYMLNPPLSSCKLMESPSALATKLLCDFIVNKINIQSKLIKYNIIERGS